MQTPRQVRLVLSSKHNQDLPSSATGIWAEPVPSLTWVVEKPCLLVSPSALDRQPFLPSGCRVGESLYAALASTLGLVFL